MTAAAGRIGRDLSSLLSTLFRARWSPYKYDQQLYPALLLGLKSIRFRGLHCYFTERDVLVSVLDTTSKRNRFDASRRDSIVARTRTQWTETKAKVGQPHYYHETVDKSTGVVSLAIPDHSSIVTKQAEMERAIGVANIALGVYERRPDWATIDAEGEATVDNLHQLPAHREEIDFIHGIMTSALAVLYDVVRQRMRRFSAFSKEISIRYWDDAIPALRARHSSSADASRLFLAPWDRNDAVAVATLSLDLRKSTFCMEQSEELGEFARLLTIMVQILTKITHLHGGVFDKFTGDGCIVHFLDREQRVLFRNTAATAAFECAIDMQIGIGWVVARLRRILRHDSDLLGAGIGVDCGSSYWSIDHQYNPVVVGRPVVGACRLCGVAVANDIFFTNVAYQELEGKNQGRFVRTNIDGKDLPADLKLAAWNCREDGESSQRRPEVEALCSDVEEHGYADF